VNSKNNRGGWEFRGGFGVSAVRHPAESKRIVKKKKGLKDFRNERVLSKGIHTREGGPAGAKTHKRELTKKEILGVPGAPRVIRKQETNAFGKKTKTLSGN